MARKATRAANGGGSIRQRKDGLWEARYTVGRDPGTGKQVRKSVYGQTQKEVRQKLTKALAAIDSGVYVEPSRLTVGQWLDIWRREYLVDVSENTASAYDVRICKHIKPALGAVRLEALNTHTIQGFYNSLSKPRGDSPGLSSSTIAGIHGVLHGALEQAVKNGYIRFNPSNACTLPRMERRKIVPFDETETVAFMEAVKGHRFETLFLVALFTGMREGELLGLSWAAVDFNRGMICIEKQLQWRKSDGGYYFTTPKSGKSRTITPAPYVMRLLRSCWAKQAEARLLAGAAWEESGLVFCNELGRHLTFRAVYCAFKKVAASIGCPSARFHDLRHTYAVSSIRAGDDVKTVQGNLGHASAAFTLDIYGHVTAQMQKESANRMEDYIAALKNC